MIKLLLGGVGSGKSLSAVKMILNKQEKVFTNFHVYNTELTTRIKVRDIITKEFVNEKKTKIKKDVNWQFWINAKEKYKNFHVFLDEIHNIMHSRRSMSTDNVLMSKWFSQIRKICGSSESTDLVIISQEENKVDIDIKNLVHEVIFCEKKTGLRNILTVCRDNKRLFKRNVPGTWIIQYHFIGNYALDNYLAFRQGARSYDYRTYFYANPYFKFFDSYEIVEFGEGIYL